MEGANSKDTPQEGGANSKDTPQEGGAKSKDTPQEAPCSRRRNSMELHPNFSAERLQRRIQELRSLIDERMGNLQDIVNNLCQTEVQFEKILHHHSTAKILGITGGVTAATGLFWGLFTLNTSLVIIGVGAIVGIGGIVEAVKYCKKRSEFEEEMGKLVADFQTWVTPIQNRIDEVKSGLDNLKSSQLLSMNMGDLKRLRLSELCSESMNSISLALLSRIKTDIAVTTGRYQEVVNMLSKLKTELSREDFYFHE